jgi:hypothetical protein
MVDYHKSTGNSGTMRIRDLGTTVEFWITSGNSTTFHHQLPWRYTVNGSTSSWRQFDYNAGSGYQRLATFQIHTSQNVTFYLGDTGTSGFGGPTTFTQFINRASAPSTPAAPTLSNITNTSIQVTMVDPANNGAAIDSREIAYRASNNIVGATNTGNIGSDRTINITGLASGVTWYFWARAHNSQGWSNWSAVRSGVTHSVPAAPSAPTISEISQVSAKLEWTANSNGGSAITGYDIGYQLTALGDPPPFAPTTIVAVGSSPHVVTGLTPGAYLTFGVRAKNVYGAGAWSAVTTMEVVAGARINVGGVHKRAVPYVNVGGVWKVARPWGRIAGVWKETT